MYPSTISLNIPSLNERVRSGLICAGVIIDSGSDLGVGLQLISQTVEPVNWIVENIKTSNGLELYLFCYISNYKVSAGLISDGIRCLRLKYVDLESQAFVKS